MRRDLLAAGVPARSRVRGTAATGAIVLLGVIAVLYYTRTILIPFAFALTLTFLLTPLVTQLERLHVGRVVAVLASVLVALATAGGIGWVIANQLVDVATQLPEYRQNIDAKIAAFHITASGGLGKAAQSVEEVVRELSSPAPVAPAPSSLPRGQSKPRTPVATPAAPLPVRVVSPPASEWSELRELGMPILAPLGRAGMVMIFTIFMLLKREDLRNRLLRLVGLGQLNLMTQALDDASARVGRYLQLQFLVNAGFGIVFGFGLYFIGVPYPALWGAVAAIFRIVPYVGTPVAAMLPIALSLAVFDGWHKPLLVFLLFAAIELVVANALEPCLYGAHVGISSLGLLVTSVFWAVLWGPAGLILSTPLTVCVVVLGQYVPQFSFLHILLGDQPVLSAEAQIYQRLLAMDQQEAQAIVTEFLKSGGVVELYDSVLIPALALAEQDRHKGGIDAAREEFLFLSINEMIAEYSGYEPAESAAEAESSAPAEPAGDASHRIFCLPAHDRADEVTAAMLAQLLEQKGYPALSFPIGGSTPKDILTLIEAGPKDIVCISALPPYAFGPAKNLCKQIRERFPKTKVLVCIWGFAGDTVKATARFERTQPDYLCVSLADTMESILRLTGRQKDLPHDAGKTESQVSQPAA